MACLRISFEAIRHSSVLFTVMISSVFSSFLLISIALFLVIHRFHHYFIIPFPEFSSPVAFSFFIWLSI